MCQNFFIKRCLLIASDVPKFEFHTCQRFSKKLRGIPTKSASIFVEKEHFGKSKISKLQSRAKIKLKKACFWSQPNWCAIIPILFVINPRFVMFLIENSSYILANDSLKNSDAYQQNSLRFLSKKKIFDAKNAHPLFSLFFRFFEKRSIVSISRGDWRNWYVRKRVPYQHWAIYNFPKSVSSSLGSNSRFYKSAPQHTEYLQMVCSLTCSRGNSVIDGQKNLACVTALFICMIPLTDWCERIITSFQRL